MTALSQYLQRNGLPAWDRLTTPATTESVELAVAGTVDWEVGDVLLLQMPNDLHSLSPVIRVVTGIDGGKLFVGPYKRQSQPQMFVEFPADSGVRFVSNADLVN